MKNRRRSPRVNVSFPVECRSLPSQKYFYTVTKDLSLKGVKIVSDKFISKNKLIRLDINLVDKLLSLKAKVAWCNRTKACDRHTIGLEFLEIKADDLKNISALFA